MVRYGSLRLNRQSGEVSREQNVTAEGEGVVRSRRFLRPNIKRRTAQVSGVKCRQQRGFVNHSTSRGVDHQSAFRHEGELFGRQQASSRSVERYMHAHDVGATQQFVEAQAFDSAGRGKERVITAHIHAQAKRQSRRLGARGAKSHNADRSTPQLKTHVPHPLPAPDLAV